MWGGALHSLAKQQARRPCFAAGTSIPRGAVERPVKGGMGAPAAVRGLMAGLGTLTVSRSARWRGRGAALAMPVPEAEQDWPPRSPPRGASRCTLLDHARAVAAVAAAPSMRSRRPAGGRGAMLGDEWGCCSETGLRRWVPAGSQTLATLSLRRDQLAGLALGFASPCGRSARVQRPARSASARRPR
jgi:hypothetical protein